MCICDIIIYIYIHDTYNNTDVSKNKDPKPHNSEYF